MTETFAELARLGTATVHEATGRAPVVDLPLIRIVPDSRAAGPARTVRCGQDDNLMVHAAVAEALPGEVLVLTMPKPAPVALVGELLATQALGRGVAAILVDAAVRDVDELREILERALHGAGRADEALQILERRCEEAFFSFALHHRLATEHIERGHVKAAIAASTTGRSPIAGPGSTSCLVAVNATSASMQACPSPMSCAPYPADSVLTMGTRPIAPGRLLPSAGEQECRRGTSSPSSVTS